jgi:hypothetical protein
MTTQLAPRTIDGIIYYPEVGVIHQVLNGPESHNIPAWNIYFMFGNVGQGTGNRRSNTASGKAEIASILKVLRGSSLEALEGKTAVALHSGCPSGQIAGIANADNLDEYVIFHR